MTSEASHRKRRNAGLGEDEGKKGHNSRIQVLAPRLSCEDNVPLTQAIVEAPL
jgi:hypothetical protein